MRVVSGQIVRGVLSAAGIAFLLGLAAWMAALGFGKLGEMRQLERVPRTSVAAVTGGEVNLAGVAQPKERTLHAPDTKTETLYYRYHVERRERDSDGNDRWRTVTDRVEKVPFRLVDETGHITVVPGGSVSIEATLDHRREEGDRRYSEYRIDPGDGVFLFGVAAGGSGSYEVRFDRPGHFTPIISEHGETRARSGMALGSLAATWGALAFATGAILLLCLLLRIHQTALFLALVSTTAFVGLIYWGWSAAHMELRAATERHEGAAQRAQSEMAASFKRHDIVWDGDWETLGSLNDPQYAGLPVGERERLSRIRLDLARGAERTRTTWTRVPERIVAWRTASKPPASIPVPERDRPALAALDADFEATALPRTEAFLAQAGGLLVAGLFSWFGFRRIRVKRLIENIPTSLSGGVAYGLTELKGEVISAPATEPLISPLAESECAFFHYIVEEKRGSGKNRRWVTIEEKKQGQRFLVRDREGDFPIQPEGAEVISTARMTKRHSHRRYSEYRIDIGARLYALGRAVVDPETGSSLYLAGGEEPFILSNLGERELMLRKAFGGFTQLSAAFLALLAVALAAIGAAGSFSGLAYLLAAMTGPAFLVSALGVLMYNDLVFLRHRVAATWSNIGVSLQKRADLLPNLQELLSGYLDHERDLQRELAELRAAAEGARGMSRQQAAGFIEREHSLVERVGLLVERHPELKGSELMQQFHSTLVWLENEIALMRDGFNNAVERYNTRCGQFPELLLARLFRFYPADLFRARAEVHAVPQIRPTQPDIQRDAVGP